MGRRGNDLLRGDTGNDKLYGGTGDDFLVGGLGRDMLTGGAGWDRFEFYSTRETGIGFGNRDCITDFQRGADKIDLSGIDANSKKAGKQAFHFIGQTAQFDGTAGALKVFFENRAGTAYDRTVVAGDINGDCRPDFQIGLKGFVHLYKSDFLL